MNGEEFPHTAGPQQEPDVPADGQVTARKRQLRAHVLRARRLLTPADLDATGQLLADHVVTLLDGRSCVAAYVSMGDEPGTETLLERLHEAGVRVLLPVLLPDDDLDWAPYAGPGSLVTGRRGVRQPSGPALGVEAITEADLVLVPGLAVSPDGVRLGRGGGSYDRALTRLDSARGRATTVVALHPGEVGLAVPAEAHDRRVDLAVTREGVTRPG